MKNDNAMTKYYDFQVLGAELEGELKALAEQIAANEDKLRVFTINYLANPKAKYALSLLPEELKYEALQKILNRYKNKKITFYNSRDIKCELEGCVMYENTHKVGIKAHFVKNNRAFSSYLDTFLDYSHDFNCKEFAKDLHYSAEKYYGQLEQKVLKQIKSFDKKYKAHSRKCKKNYDAELSKTAKIVTEAIKPKKRILNAEEALNEAKKNKGTEEVRKRHELFSEKELKDFVHSIPQIERIYVSVLDKGQSGEAINRNYQNLSGIKHRQLKTNEEGKTVGHDRIYAQIIFKKGANIPVATLKKLCKGQRGPDLLSPYGKDREKRRLCNTALTLYILNEYNEFGVEANKKDLYKHIDKEGLLNTLL